MVQLALSHAVGHLLMMGLETPYPTTRPKPQQRTHRRESGEPCIDQPATRRPSPRAKFADEVLYKERAAIRHQSLPPWRLTRKPDAKPREEDPDVTPRKQLAATEPCKRWQPSVAHKRCSCLDRTCGTVRQGRFIEAASCAAVAEPLSSGCRSMKRSRRHGLDARCLLRPASGYAT